MEKSYLFLAKEDSRDVTFRIRVPHPKAHCAAVPLCVSLKAVQGPLPAFRLNITNEKKRDRSNKGARKNIGLDFFNRKIKTK